MDFNNGELKINSVQFEILDSMMDGVRLIDINNNIIHTNKSLKEILGKDTKGMKCYKGIGQKRKCAMCVTEKTFETSETYRKEEVINGKIYDVVSSPVYNNDDEIIAVVEVFRDTTKEKELEKSIVEKNKKMISDIEFAMNMQKNMLPPKGIYGNMKINYLYKPSEMLSGDIFDVFSIDNNNFGIYICDVVGHGITASMISMYVKQTVRAISKRVIDLNKIMQELHRTFIALNFDDDKYFSIFFCIFNKKTKTLKYMNAGHNCLPIFKRNNNIKELQAKGYPICNIFDTVNYELFEMQLQEKDKIVFFTDGIIEIKNFKNEEFGVERLKRIVKEYKYLPYAINKEINEFKGNQKDDIAVLEVEIL